MMTTLSITTADPILHAALLFVPEYGPAMRNVCRRWHRVLRALAVKPLKPSQLAARGHGALLEWCAEIDAAKCMVAAAEHGHLGVVLQCKRRGGARLDWVTPEYDDANDYANHARAPACPAQTPVPSWRLVLDRAARPR